MLKNYISAFLICLFFQGTVFAHTPCNPSTGMAGVYPCNDYDLMSNLPISTLATTISTAEGSDIWGWTDGQSRKQYAIVGTTNSTAFVDLSDPVNPIFLGDEVDEQGFGNNTRTLVFDRIDLEAHFSNTALLKTYTGPTLAIDHNGYVNGDKFYLANYRAGMRVLDIPKLISSTNSASEIGFFDTSPSSNSANFNGAWSIYPYFASGNIIISDIEHGLFVVRPSNTLSTTEYDVTGSFSLSPNPTTSVSAIKNTSNSQINSVQIYNILGQKVYENNNINTKAFVLPVKHYAKGLFLIKINNSKTKKLVIK